MAYQTGTAADFVALADAIRAFTSANGWTANMWQVNAGSDWRLHISKGAQYVNFLAQPLIALWITGSDGYDSGVGWNAQPVPSPYFSRMRSDPGGQFIGGAAWPVTYHLFSHSSPDSVECVIEYAPAKYQWMMFGQITKFGDWSGSGAYVGATWMANDTTTLSGIDGSIFKIFQDQSEFGTLGRYEMIPFGAGSHVRKFSADSPVFGTPLRASIDSETWVTSRSEPAKSAYINAAIHAYPLVARGVSAFNGLTVLQPIWPMMRRPDAHWSCLGRVEHVRYANVINHLPGEVIDLGPDRWMLFPALGKGSATDSAGLHAGFAVRYDGP